ncbi:MAG: patatin-like phospholipase family protein [Alphaproteobacteria bacterium]|nr:patatin-like phospholipase family protein [Alphaproteobacteria bacterium]
MEMSPRDRHLFGPGPKRILAFDGGGIRGMLSIAFLERLEALIEEIEGKPVRLCEWFDLIGGTSTGSIIATAAALGYWARDIKAFYATHGAAIFRKRWLWLAGLQSQFQAENLRRVLVSIVGDRTLGSEDVQTGLCIVTKRMDTGSSWILMNNPKSKYWETPADHSFIGNKHYSLANLVRASGAAPVFFEPELIEIAAGMEPGLFVDGGVSPHNNPALYMLLAASSPKLELNWPLGPENLLIVSIGTGSSRHTISEKQLPWLKSAGIAIHALQGQMSDAQQLVVGLMSWLGESPTQVKFNEELGDLSEAGRPFGRPLFRFLRYDVQLEQRWLRDELGRTFSEAEVMRLRELAAVENLGILHELGARAASKQMRREHLQRRGNDA